MSKPQIDLKFGADLKDFRRGMQNIDRSLSRLSGGFQTLGGVIGASFAIDAITSFTAEAVELGAKMEGVRVGFERLNDPNLLNELRAATSGSVDDLTLMQKAIQAKNFRIPMDVLAKGLRFATQRAYETGESVDYLVDSFVTGLGRESVKILDNLGLSVKELQEKQKELGSMAAAVGVMMEESFAEAGEQVVTTAVKIDQQRAAIKNLKTEIGERLAPTYSAFLDNTLEMLDTINTMLSNQIKGSERLSYIASFFTAGGSAVRAYLDATVDAREAVEVFTEATDDAADAQGNLNEQHENGEKEVKKHNEAYTMLGESFGAYLNMLKEMEQVAPVTFQIAKEATEDFITAGQKLHDTFMGISDLIGTTLAQSFEAALINGDSFLQVFADGLKVLVAQIAAAVAAAAVLALVLTLATGGLGGLSMGSLGTAFRQVGGGMGLPSFLLPQGASGGRQSIEIFGTLSGSDLLLSNERAARNRGRSRGF